jgi:hypothetical protein
MSVDPGQCPASDVPPLLEHVDVEIQVPETPALFVQVVGLVELLDAAGGLSTLELEGFAVTVGFFTTVVPGLPDTFAAAFGPNPKQKLGRGSDMDLRK